MPQIQLFNRKVGDGAPVLVIAEIGLNFNGSFETAMRLVDAAAEAGADVIKFQKRTMKETYREDVLADPNKSEQAFQYLLPILAENDLTLQQFRTIKARVEELGKFFLCTPWDDASVDFLEELGVEAYKVASSDMSNWLLLEKIAKTGKPMLVSTAMHTQEEMDKTAAFLTSLGVPYLLNHCVGAYPCPYEDLNVRYLAEMTKRYQVPIGYSSNERGFYPTLAAVAFGACAVERHITFDRMQEGPDHAGSLEPKEFGEMVRAIRVVELSLGRPKKLRSYIETMNRKVLGKSLVAANDITPGTIVTREMLRSKGPAKGLAPYRFQELLGRKIQRTIPRDGYFDVTDLGEEPYHFVRPEYKTPWALKTRFSEIDFAEQFAPPIFEFHLSDKDVEQPFMPKKTYSQQLYVHAPDYMGRRLKDLSAEDDDQWEASIAFCQKMIDKIRRLTPSFSGTPHIIIHVGGMFQDPRPRNTEKLYERATAAFRRLSYDGVVLLPENMPPYGWYFSGEWYNHAFLEAQELVDFAKQFNLKVCFDTAHARLAMNVLRGDYRAYVETIAPHTAYVQVSDASGFRNEAVQVGEGEIDFAEVFTILNKYPGWTWCPEIWEGHLDGYRGFLDALHLLKPYIA